MPRNETEQQRIAAALESMAGNNDGSTKKNVTEQQRIASAIEAIAEGGGAGGGTQEYIITITGVYDEETDESTYVSDKTFSEIDAAYGSGKALVVYYDDGEGFAAQRFEFSHNGAGFIFYRMLAPFYANNQPMGRFDVFNIELNSEDDSTVILRHLYAINVTED